MAGIPSLSLVWWYEHLLCMEENISAEVMEQLGRLVEEQTEGLPTHVQARLYLRALRTPPSGDYAPPLPATEADALEALCTLSAVADLPPSDVLTPEVLQRLRPPPALINEVAAAHLALRLAAAVRSKKKIPTQQQVQEHLQELTRAAGCEDIVSSAGLQTKVVRINRVLNTNVATTGKGGLAPKAASDLAAALEAAAGADAAQRKMDAYVASAWAALGPSYLQEHEQEVLANPAAAGPLATYGQDWTAFAAAAGVGVGGAGSSATAAAGEGAAAAAADGAGPSAAAAPGAPAAAAEQQQAAGGGDGAAQPSSGGRWLRSMGGATPALKLPGSKRGKRGAGPSAEQAAAGGTSEPPVAAAEAGQQQQQQQQQPVADAKAAEAVPAKRGRGRPRKSSTAAAAPAGELAVEGPAAAAAVAAAPAGEAEVAEQPAAAPVAFIVGGTGEQPFLAPLAPAVAGGGGGLDAAAAAGGGYDLGLDGGDLKRRKTIRWTPEETDFFIQLVYKHGPGNWKAVMAAAEGGELNNRTQVDLKDKWRNLENSGRVLRDRSDQLRAVGLLHDGPEGGDDAYYGD